MKFWQSYCKNKTVQFFCLTVYFTTPHLRQCRRVGTVGCCIKAFQCSLHTLRIKLAYIDVFIDIQWSPSVCYLLLCQRCNQDIYQVVGLRICEKGQPQKRLSSFPFRALPSLAHSIAVHISRVTFPENFAPSIWLWPSGCARQNQGLNRCGTKELKSPASLPTALTDRGQLLTLGVSIYWPR